MMALKRVFFLPLGQEEWRERQKGREENESVSPKC